MFCTKGRGFVAVGLVIVARWNANLVLPVVLLFGVSEAATLRLQATGLTLSPYLIGCLPYVVCLAFVVIVSPLWECPPIQSIQIAL
jgi:general nucleoside transport system permease protein